MCVVKMSIFIVFFFPFTNIIFTWKLTPKNARYSPHPSHKNSGTHIDFAD